MLYYAYVIRSLKNGDLYVGSTKDISRRLDLHNKCKVKSTKAYVPWELLQCEEFTSRRKAFHRERFLKNHQQEEILKKKYAAT